MSSQTILVAGGGIGGLTAALALARRGFKAHVLEKAAKLGEVGAGIQLGPNASMSLTNSGSAMPPATWRCLSTVCG